MTLKGPDGRIMDVTSSPTNLERVIRENAERFARADIGGWVVVRIPNTIAFGDREQFVVELGEFLVGYHPDFSKV